MQGVALRRLFVKGLTPQRRSKIGTRRPRTPSTVTGREPQVHRLHPSLHKWVLSCLKPHSVVTKSISEIIKAFALQFLCCHCICHIIQRNPNPYSSLLFRTSHNKMAFTEWLHASPGCKRKSIVRIYFTDPNSCLNCIWGEKSEICRFQ